MEYKKLGKSDVLVSELILGCWAMGGDYFGATEDKSSLEALEVSYENGVNTFDTAEIYGDGRSERVVGEAARRIGRRRGPLPHSLRAGGKRKSHMQRHAGKMPIRWPW